MNSLLEISLFVTAFFSAGSAHPLEKRMTAVAADSLKLYAYGVGIGGLPVFLADGVAQIGEPTLSAASTKTPMTVRIPSGNKVQPSMWVADVDRPKVKAGEVAAFAVNGNLASSSPLALKTSDDSVRTSALVNADPYAKPVVLATTENESGTLTDVWYLYGSFVLLSVPDAAFYAQPTGTDGLYNLMWSSTKMASLDCIPVTVKTTAPATGPAQMISDA